MRASSNTSAGLTSQALVIGAGPAGMMAAERLAMGGVAVTVIDRMPSPGRKLLMAGAGGLNMTHREAIGPFISRYGEAAAALAPAITAFPPVALRGLVRGARPANLHWQLRPGFPHRHEGLPPAARLASPAG